MKPTKIIQPNFVEFIPTDLKEGILYISNKYQTCSHLCCCGCGNKVVTPLKPSGWSLNIQKGKATLYPSIGNWNFACQSHYWVRSNEIMWATKWTKSDIEAVRISDREARSLHYDHASKPDSFWMKIISWFWGS